MSTTSTHPRPDPPDRALDPRIGAVAAVCLILSGLVFLIAETVSAAAWSTPGYSYLENYISDLGNPICGPFDGRVLCSPLAGLMNGGLPDRACCWAWAPCCWPAV